MLFLAKNSVVASTLCSSQQNVLWSPLVFKLHHTLIMFVPCLSPYFNNTRETLLENSSCTMFFILQPFSTQSLMRISFFVLFVTTLKYVYFSKVRNVLYSHSGTFRKGAALYKMQEQGKSNMLNDTSASKLGSLKIKTTYNNFCC